ncbi:ATP-binding protein [Mycolicibacterium arenosum]|uniref:LuxR C-terminal-related transcriptional regulator n=1 Tax=Mycolicibacterium arenosum TaxID=2952157 RepID=A0ABT1MAK0_9MYCO|nr:LuxR family transcriptional regulator [Mycolicibacterium sp. CAU 1645]MCP9275417.1 LuxR C-terminal-related transcriptional regulator [Mycolicibacterium sp. CAU 1645]
MGDVASLDAHDFLTRATFSPVGLVIEGAMGIGKTTLWSTVVEQARERGFRVLSARAVQAESVLAYAVVADLLADADPALIDGLSAVQRIAVDRVLLNDRSDGLATDQRVTAAAFTSIVGSMAEQGPLLIAIDDVQWLDASTRAVIGFAARRLKGGIGILVTERTGGVSHGSTHTWLQMSAGLASLLVRPMPFGTLHAVVQKRLGRSFAKSTMTRIHEISGGNPFFAIELARSIVDSGGGTGRETLSATLSEVMRLRLAPLSSDVREALLAASCVADPTVDVVAAAIDQAIYDVVETLEFAENDGVVTLDGNHIRFEHPLLAHGVYTQASAADRRRMHRALAGVETHPELKARHLALATVSTDPDTLKALDAAAEAATARGAPAAAAELFELAIQRGGDTPMRRFRAAASLLAAGDAIAGRAMLEPAIDTMPPGTMRAAALNLLAGLCVHANRYLEAIGHLTAALPHAAENPLLQVQTLQMLSLTQLADGAFEESLHNAELAVAEAEQLGIPPLTSQVLTMWVMANCVCGNGVDEAANARALAMEDHGLNVPIAFRASASNAQLLAWKGDLVAARAQIADVRRRSEERGAESDLLHVAIPTLQIELWSGNFDHAEAVVRDIVERAEDVGGEQPTVMAQTARTVMAAYRGRVDEARIYGGLALEAAELSGARRVGEWPTMMLGFLETSLGNYPAALNILRDFIVRFPTTPTGTELSTATFIPDAVEALVAVGRADEAEPLVAALEDNGARLDRPWMLAVGARCRAIVLAADGDLPGALAAARLAVVEHQRLSMPFELARTQVVLGELLRRSRQKGAAQTLNEAVAAFDRMGAALWAQRARDELSRTVVGRTDGVDLTPGERRVAERAAAGLSNKEIAVELHVSVKTVESNLSNAYRKLGIRSRSQLAGRLADAVAT